MTDVPCKNGLLPWSSDSIIHWLLEEGRFLGNMDAIVQQLGQKMLDSGAPLWRLRLAMRTLHPLTTAISAAWELDFEEAEVIESPHGLENRPDYSGSPLGIISSTGEVFRKRLSDELSDPDHEVLFEFKVLGVLLCRLQFAVFVSFGIPSMDPVSLLRYHDGPKNLLIL